MALSKIGPTIYLPPKQFGKVPNIRCDTVPHIIGHKMVLDALPHPARSLTTTFRTFLQFTIVAVGCSWPATALLFAAELFPYAPPSSSQQRSVEQYPAPTPQLSSEDEKRISKIAAQAKQLSPTDRNQLKSSIQNSLDEAFAKGNLNQAKYFSELLRQID